MTPTFGRAIDGRTEAMLRLPEETEACLFDLDGVLTQTAKIHAQAWKQMFDDFLHTWAERTDVPFEAFDRPTDYDEYVDGKPRWKASGPGSPSDPPERETAQAS